MKTITYTQNAILLSVAFLTVAAFAPAAHADETSVGADSRAVHYSDLNLNTAAGAKVLYQRIRSAAEQVCGDVGSRQMEVAAAAKACVDSAVVSSVRRVNSAQLTRTASTHGYEVDSRLNVAAAR